MSLAEPDELSKSKSIYDVSKTEVFWRNFIAGLGRGLGNFLFTLLVFVIFTSLLATAMQPYINPLLSTLSSLSGIMATVNNAQSRTSR